MADYPQLLIYSRLFILSSLLLVSCFQQNTSTPVVVGEQKKSLVDIKAEIRNTPGNLEKQSVNKSPFTLDLALYMKDILEKDEESPLLSSTISPGLYRIFQDIREEIQERPDASYDEIIQKHLIMNNLDATDTNIASIANYMRNVPYVDLGKWTRPDATFLMAQRKARELLHPANKKDYDLYFSHPDAASYIYGFLDIANEQPIKKNDLNIDFAETPEKCWAGYSVNESGYGQIVDEENNFSAVINASDYTVSVSVSCGYQEYIEHIRFFTSFFKDGKKVIYQNSSGDRNRLIMSLCFDEYQQNIDYIEHFAIVAVTNQGEFRIPPARLVIDRDFPCRLNS